MIGYCDTFWGSHGCSLDEGHETDGLETHLCLINMGDEKVTCSELRKLDDKGAAEIRWGGSDEWSKSGNWHWFSNHGDVR